MTSSWRTLWEPSPRDPLAIFCHCLGYLFDVVLRVVWEVGFDVDFDVVLDVVLGLVSTS